MAGSMWEDGQIDYARHNGISYVDIYVEHDRVMYNAYTRTAVPGFMDGLRSREGDDVKVLPFDIADILAAEL